MRRLLLPVLAACLLASAAVTASAESQFLGKPLKQWLSDLSDKKAETRRHAAFALGKIGAEGDPKPVLAALVKALRDDDAGVRDVSASAIGDLVTALGDQAKEYWSVAGPNLIKVLRDDSEPRVRRSAACALGAYGADARPARDDLVKALDDKAAMVRQNAAWALGHLGQDAGEPAIDRLRELLKDADPAVRRDAAGALGEIDRPLARPAAQALLDIIPGEKDGVVRRAALEALSHLAGPEDRASAGQLVPLLDDPDPDTRWSTAFVLATIGGPEGVKALPVLEAALKGEDPHIQELAAVALGRLGPEAAPAADALGEALTTAKEVVTRRNAALALARIGPPAKGAVRQIVLALKPGEGADAMYNEVRPYAAEALVNIKYPNTEKAIPAVLDVIQNDPDPVVRQRCIWVLFDVEDLQKYNAIKPLTAVLDETERETTLVRYDAARILAIRLREKAPDKTVEVLMHMLKNTDLVVFNATETKTSGVGSEAGGGKSEVKVNQGGDARYMAAEALGWLGRKAAGRKDVVDALKEAAEDKDKKLREKARAALQQIGQ